MVTGLLAKRILQRYFLTLPNAKRQVQYLALSKVGWLLPVLEEIKPEVLPEAVSPAAEEAAVAQVAASFIQAPTPYYHQYRCTQDNPLSCQSEVTQGLSTCEQCGFPSLLPTNGQLIGKQGNYQIGKLVNRRGIGRLYEGVQLGAEKPVTIQEYLLPERYFSREEQSQYQELFTSLAGLSLADGRMQDMRMVLPLEAIADAAGERCYLVTPAIDRSPSLNRYCAQQGAFDNQTVLDVLNQVLQTLTCLHQQKFTLPGGQINTGIVHGGLSSID